MCSTKFLVATLIAAELERTLLGGSGELRPDIIRAHSFLPSKL